MKAGSGNKQKGMVLVELSHGAIPDDELCPEDFNEDQLALLSSIPPEHQEKIRKGYPVFMVDLVTGNKLGSFNLKNFALEDYKKEAISRILLEATHRRMQEQQGSESSDVQKPEN